MQKVYDTKWFLSRMKESHPNDYEDYVLKSKYIDSHHKVKLYHKPCGKTIEMMPTSFTSGRGCQKCGRKKAAIKEMKSIEEAQKDIPNYIHILSGYNGAFSKVLVHCDHCNNTYKVGYHDLTRKYCCSICKGNHTNYTTSLLAKEISDVTCGEYSLIGTYVKATKKVSIKHNVCGNTYLVTPHNFRHGRRCPYCYKSRGEKNIEYILKRHKISYESQKKFPNLVIKGNLSYDFYLPKYNTLIEYQGEQHYKPVRHFGGKAEFRIQMERDKEKREYAKSMGYKLLEIPYTIYKPSDIENHILEFIKNM